jgi:hypothetical protein
MKLVFMLVFMSSLSVWADPVNFDRKSLNDLASLVTEINSKLPDNYCAPSKSVVLTEASVTSEALSALLKEDVEKVETVKKGFDVSLSVMATLIDVVSDEEKAQAVGTQNLSALMNKVWALQFEKGVKIFKFFMPDFYAHSEIGGLVVLDTAANKALIVSFPFCP